MNCDMLRGMRLAFLMALDSAQAQQFLHQREARLADPTGFPHMDSFWTADAVNSSKAAQQAIQPPTLASMAAIGAYQAVLADIALVAIWQGDVTGVNGQLAVLGC